VQLMNQLILQGPQASRVTCLWNLLQNAISRKNANFESYDQSQKGPQPWERLSQFFLVRIVLNFQ